MIAIVGDLQRTTWPERLLGREQNEAERRAIVAALGAERPDLLLLLGDLVAIGSNAGDWRYFDELAAGLRTGPGALAMAMGNHDWFALTRRAHAAASTRFPHLRERTWHARDDGSIRLLVLDSNPFWMPRGAWERQRDWFAAELARAEGDPAVRATVAFTHHPPYTNSRRNHDSRAAGELVALARDAAKLRLWVSGHAHGYERFEKEGRAFVVTGGGGGARVRYLTGPAERHADVSPVRGDFRPFNYLLLDETPRGIRVRTKGFAKGEREPRELDRFELPFGPTALKCGR